MRIICLPVSGGLPPDPISTSSNDQTSRQDYVNLTINCICVFVIVSVYLASGFDDEICSQGLCQLGHQRYLSFVCVFFVLVFLLVYFSAQMTTSSNGHASKPNVHELLLLLFCT